MLDDVEHHHGPDRTPREEICELAGKTLAHGEVDHVAFESSRHDIGHSVGVPVPAYVLPPGVTEHICDRCVTTAEIEDHATPGVALDETHGVAVRAVPREGETIGRDALGHAAPPRPQPRPVQKRCSAYSPSWKNATEATVSAERPSASR